MESAWESWIRPVLLVAVAGLVGLAWYLKWIPDAVVGIPLGAAAFLGAGGAVALRVKALGASPLVTKLGFAALGAALLVSLWSPWVMVGPGGEIAGADLTVDNATLTLPPTGSGPERYRVYFRGRPAFGATHASVHLELRGLPGAPKATRVGRLDTQQLKGAQGGGKAIERRDIVWPITADLSQGGQLSAREGEAATLAWPTHLEIHHAPPAPVAPAAVGAGIFLIALALEASNKRRARSWLSTLAGATPLFTLLFGAWYAPGHLTATIFGATLVSAVGGTVLSYSLLPLFRSRLAPPAPAQPAEA